jgi:benzoyl-CoA reductase/2-hydroxyglutaryl-CoA dehydratase subunit BcrC/BadD/HgdB
VLREQFGLYDEIERGGARIVLDATETGERTLPAPFDRERLRNDPLEELARAYFQHIPDVFRRPNERLYEWLATELSARRVQGILLLRCVWCDLWHAEAARLKERLNLPVLELEPSGMAAETPRTQVRVQALLELFT